MMATEAAEAEVEASEAREVWYEHSLPVLLPICVRGRHGRSYFVWELLVGQCLFDWRATTLQRRRLRVAVIRDHSTWRAATG
jgi:hypothetical protein